jgi:hypothetical protein
MILFRRSLAPAESASARRQRSSAINVTGPVIAACQARRRRLRADAWGHRAEAGKGTAGAAGPEAGVRNPPATLKNDVESMLRYPERRQAAIWNGRVRGVERGGIPPHLARAGRRRAAAPGRAARGSTVSSRTGP